MLTILFITGYIILIAVLSVAELIYWVYTGVGSIAWAEHLLSILLSRLFLQIVIPLLLIDLMVNYAPDIIDRVKQHYNK